MASLWDIHKLAVALLKVSWQVKHSKRQDYGAGQAQPRLQPVSIQLASYR